MQNLVMRRDGNRLVIEIDLGQTLGPSSTGKTLIVATSRGNKPVPGAEDTFLGLNCFRYASPRAKKTAAP